jgi:hypothetical protein
MKSKGKKQVAATAAQSSYHDIVYFEPQSDGSFAVVFPTFPEIVTFGRTLDEARDGARRTALPSGRTAQGRRDYLPMTLQRLFANANRPISRGR